MEMIMSTTLGEDWRSFFHMAIANARKSYFWSEDRDPPMYIMDKSKFGLKGPIVKSGINLMLDP